MTTDRDTPSLTQARRIVVKIGSALLVDPNNESIRTEWLDALIDGVAALRDQGKDVLIVSSGAIALGRCVLGVAKRGRFQKMKLAEQHAAAATGQIRLAHAYQTSLERHGLVCAQLLISPEDTENRRRHLNGRATLETLLKLGVVPIINENDTVTTQEIRFGDNDRLAARVAQMASADALVLLSDIDGLYTADPRVDKFARHIPLITELTPNIMAMAGEPPPGYSSGGMVTKLEAARIALSAGCDMVIAKGEAMNPLELIDKTATLKTWFTAKAEPLTARKKWIAAHLQHGGTLVIDDGAAKALKNGKSLLPAGVMTITGDFQRGDPITITDSKGQEIGHGLSGYDSDEARKIAGHKTDDIFGLLGHAGRGPMVHHDDLVLE